VVSSFGIYIMLLILMVQQYKRAWFYVHITFILVGES